MPSVNAHKSQALSNEALAPTLDSHAPDWAITVRFYAALHWVRGYLASLGFTNIESHEDTFTLLNNETQLSAKTIGRYRKFYNLSKKARYECLPHQDLATQVSTAQTLLEQVKQEVVPLLP